jgi:hypothetical protein
LHDGKPQRVQVSEFLCDRDKVHYKSDCKAATLKATELMLKVNSQRRSTSDMSVVDFWSSTYLPNAEKELRASAIGPYKQIWGRFLKDHFGDVKLADYTAGDHYRLLLAPRDRGLGRAPSHMSAASPVPSSHTRAISAC